MPPIPSSINSGNIFSPEQEKDLGDAAAEQIARSFRIIEDQEVTAFLQRLGDRIASHLPPSQVRFNFVLSDLPIENAYSLPGGRIFISRKLIAMMRNEDELAGVISHELGHETVHQSAQDTSRELRAVLGVTTVGDRKDVFDKFNQLLENAMRNPAAFRKNPKEGENGEITADTIAVFAMADSGYDPSFFSTLFDRVAGTKGKTGNWLSDLFGATSPESLRLRDVLKQAATIPESCIDHRNGSNPEDFKNWQASVAAYSGLGHKESLHGIVARKRLSPPLQSEYTHLKFSPDGAYLLAQDDASVYVLSRTPLAPLFRIDAPDAYPAGFSPDSQEVVFYTPALRVETWSVDGENRTSVHEIAIPEGCRQTRLSPDGKLLGCFTNKSDLSLYDVAAGTVFFQKSEHTPRRVEMQFSTDAHYFVASISEDSPVALDLATRQPISLPGKIKDVLTRHFVFLGPDRIVGVNQYKPENSAILRFPSGDEVAKIPLGDQSLEAPAHGDLLMLRPVKNYPVGVLDPASKKIILANSEAAFDLFDRISVTERASGEIVLVDVDAKSQIAEVTLPSGPLGNLRALAVSSDMQWLAVSEKTRGAVWNIAKNERAFYVHGFRSAFFGGDGLLYADFPENEKSPRQFGQLDLAKREVLPGFQPEKTEFVEQYGSVVVRLKRNPKPTDFKNIFSMFEILDVKTGQLLWARDLTHGPFRSWRSPQGETIVLDYPLSEASAQDELKLHPDWSARFASAKRDPSVHLFEIVQARTGVPTGAVLVDTNKRSFIIGAAAAAGDWLVLSDLSNRVLVYSISKGEEIGHIFGHGLAISQSAGILEVENEPGQLVLYDLATMEKRDTYTFSDRVVLTQFSNDGKQLFVLTAGQFTYTLDLTAGSATTATGKSLD
jgi:WD40 repeat protein